MIWSPEQIEGHNREYIRLGQQQGQNIDANAFYPLYDIMKDYLGQEVKDDDGNDVGPNTMPFKKFFVPVDKQLVYKNGTATPADSVVDQLAFEIPSNAIARNDLIMLNIIATNKWQRPIYFTAAYGELGFGQHLRKDGLTYRLVPFVVKTPQQNWVTDQAMRAMRAGGSSVKDNNLTAIYENLKKFQFGGANKKGVYYDEVNRQYLLNIRAIFAEAAGNLADAGKTDEAIKLLNREAEGIDPENLPYGMTSRYSQHNQTGILLTEAYYKAGKLDQARKVAEDIKKDIASQRSYYEYLKAEKPEFYAGLEHTEVILNEIMGEVLSQVEQQYDPLKKQLKTRHRNLRLKP
ncbi:tetratricopeptide repeat protein [Niabella defluvii]|nr:tetratricopeptide repeat protein [Niabella sp. I65]